MLNEYNGDVNDGEGFGKLLKEEADKMKKIRALIDILTADLVVFAVLAVGLVGSIALS